jgi:hypothetical protein
MNGTAANAGSCPIGEDIIITDPNFDRKLDAITAGAPPHLKEHLLTRISRENCQIICKYILAMQTEVAPTIDVSKLIIN